MPKGSLTKAGRKRQRTDEKKPRANSGAHREKKIIDAAVDVFHDQGYAATSVDDIADNVGILKGSLYYYMNSKEDLLLRIVEEVHEEVRDLVKKSLGDKSRPPLERLGDYIRGQMDYNAHNLKRVRVYYHDYEQLAPENLTEIRKRRRADEQAVIGLLKEAKKKRELPGDLNERVAAKTIFAILIWMYTWFKPGGAVSARELGDFSVEFIVDGLRGR